jgi:hypothetical protein
MGKKKKVVKDVTDTFDFHSEADLLLWLKQQDITVHTRSSTRHCERWGALRLLATWANTDYLSYPLRLIHRNKPDFLLCYDEHKVGIEFTEATSQELAETYALAEQDGVEERVLFMDQFKRGTPKRTASQRREIIRKQPHGPGWIDEECEKEWVKSMIDNLCKKTGAFNKPEFEKYDENWLLIYDNLPVPLIKIEDVMRGFMEALNRYWLQKNCYDGILIEKENQILQFQPSKCKKLPIVDLWGN